MAGPGRNMRCPCGSGLKVKRCCGERKGPSDVDLARAFLSTTALAVAPVLLGMDEEDLVQNAGQLVELPSRHDSLRLRLPRLVCRELDPLRRACEDEDVDGMADALPGALAVLDTPQARARLARAVVALGDSGAIDEEVAAVAVLDLASRDGDSDLMRASVLQAVAVDVGVARTAGGLLVGR